MTSPVFSSAELTPKFFASANTVIHDTLMALRPELVAACGRTAHTLKPDDSVVTQLDLQVEQRLHAALADFDARIGHAGEETAADLDQPTFWLIDPIDGTEAFIRGLPFATNMVALIHNGEPVLSVIYNFMLDQYFYACKTGGATLNGQPIHVSSRRMERAFLTFGSRLKNEHMYGTWERLRLRVQNTLQVGAAGYELSAIACGATDGIISYATRGGAWDFAPGALLIQEAGGKVANIGSDTYNYRNVELVAANAQVFDEIKTFIEAEIAAATNYPKETP